MKTKYLILVSILAISIRVQGQADQLNHTRIVGYYVGWDAGGATGPLEIRNDFNDNIDFYTAGTTPQKATILANGNFGIGISTPTSLLHTQYSVTALTSTFAANFFENLATSTTNAINKYGLEIHSTGSWSGTGSQNVGLYVDVSGGFVNYPGIFTGGNVGIETKTPDLKLSIGDINDLNADGGLLVVGSLNALSTGTVIPSGLQMPRMFWYPRKAAFRSGLSDSGEWDDALVGLASIASGKEVQAIGEYSIAMGQTCIANSRASFAIGLKPLVTAGATGAGALNSGTASADWALATNNGSAAGGLSFAANSSSAWGSNSFATGWSIARADASLAAGLGTEAKGYAEATIGMYNLPCPGCAITFPQPSDPVFEIGIGTGPTTPANAVTVLHDGRTGIGLATFPPLKDVQLHVERKTDVVNIFATAGYFDGENTLANGGYAFGVQGYGKNKSGSTCAFVSGGRFFGMGGATNGAGATQGVYGQGIGAKTTNWGGYFIANVSGNVPNLNVGVSGIATRAKLNYGVYGFAPRDISGATTNYAVVGDLGVGCLTFPAGPPCPTGPDYAGYFIGDVISLTNFFQLSDANFKDSIQDITSPLDIISQLNPKSYVYIQSSDNESMNLASGTHFGLLAQDVETILPQVVKNSVHPARYDSLGNETHASIDFKAMNYIELIPLLIGAIKEQQQNMEAMQAELTNLSGGGNRQGHHGGGSEEENSGEEEQGKSTSIDVELTNAKAIVLNQNVPNPFAEQTSISYFIPANVDKVQIFFYDNRGTILRVVDVNEKGAGTLNVFAADLSSGNYTYTLIADGKVVETKNMIKQ